MSGLYFTYFMIPKINRSMGSTSPFFCMTAFDLIQQLI